MKLSAFLVFLVLVILTVTASPQKQWRAADVPGETTQYLDYQELSDNQQLLARLFKASDWSSRIPQLIRERRQDLDVSQDLVSSCAMEVTSPTPDHRTLIDRLAERATYIVIGTVEQSVSFLNQRETAILTEHRVRLQTVLKGRVDDSSISVVRPGGKVRIDNFVAFSRNPMGLVDGARYLILLQVVPESSAYSPIASFKLVDGKAVVPDEAPPELKAEVSRLSLDKFTKRLTRGGRK